MTARRGLVLEVERNTPPIVWFHGEGLRMEKLPAGSRVVYPNEPLEPLDDVEGAIAKALAEPLGECEPLPALLFAGMKLTIAFDDVSLPLPPMAAPDIRSRVIEQVLDLAAAAGVDDVHLIAALALHRRMTEDELRHAVGDRVYDAFAPQGRLYNFDAEDPAGLTHLGRTDAGEEVEISTRAVESDLLVYVNINLVSMDGGHKSVATGLSGYTSLRHHHNVDTMVHSKSFMDPDNSELHTRTWRQGRHLAAAGVKVFQIETTLNNDTFPAPYDFLQRREWEMSPRDRLMLLGTKAALDVMGRSTARRIFHKIRAPYGVTSVSAGEVEAVHEVTLGHVARQHLVRVEGQADVLTMGLPYLCPYNVNSIMNPILVACLGLGYFFNLYRGKPLVRRGGVAIMGHPTPWEFHPVHHPSYIDFFEEVLADTTDPHEIEQRYERRYAQDEWYRHLYRTSYAYHGVHPFYMWYWCAHALEHLGAVIVVGGDTAAVRRLGFRSATTLADALEMATDVVGRDPSITHIHNPPVLMADVC
ncbi:MAG TPA: transcriptional regulator [Acidimicrobiaceae bacterium]|nr:transcriptional regulator [Acidimicrobiaceae bacterium]HCB36701.1 transcriptional regulator [Acidimicrobiaceae bacterium]